MRGVFGRYMDVPSENSRDAGGPIMRSMMGVAQGVFSLVTFFAQAKKVTRAKRETPFNSAAGKAVCIRKTKMNTNLTSHAAV